MSKKDDIPEITPETIEALRERLNAQLTEPSDPFVKYLNERMAKFEKQMLFFARVVYGDEVVDRAIAAEKEDGKD